MKKLALAGCIFLAPTLVGCKVYTCTREYSSGMECMDCRDYEAAVKHFETCVDLDPKTSCNHYNLALAYRRQGDNKQAWVHARKALRVDKDDIQAKGMCRLLGELFLDDYCVESEGYTIDQVRMDLGEPDSIQEKQESTVYTYGVCNLEFVDGKYSRTFWSN